MKRRSFLKGISSLIGLAYLSPVGLLTPNKVQTKNIQYESLSMDSFSEKIIAPAMKKLANDIDKYAFNLIKENKDARSIVIF